MVGNLYKIQSRNVANMREIGQNYISIIPNVTKGIVPSVTEGMMLKYFWPISRILGTFRL